MEGPCVTPSALQLKSELQQNPTVSGYVTPRLLTIKQAAVYCGCAIWAIRQAIWAKELQACSIGRRLLIDRVTLDSFIDNRLRERAA
jgi:excisionase family DNA binding protein